MKILDYVIPAHLQNVSFIHSLGAQVEMGKTLSRKQLESLQDIVGVNLDYHYFDFEAHEEDHEYEDILEKLKTTNFRNSKTRNRVIRALISIVKDDRRKDLIDDILYPSPQLRWY